MALPKKIARVEEPFHAVFENGILRPLRRLRLKPKSRVLVTLYPGHAGETTWSACCADDRQGPTKVVG
jgi:hypothetical protein